MIARTHLAGKGHPAGRVSGRQLGFQRLERVLERGVAFSMVRMHWRTVFVLVAILVVATVGFAIAAELPLSIVSVTPPDGATVTTAKPTVSATVQNGAPPYSGEIVLDGVTYAGVPDGTGTTFSFTPASNLADGPHSVTFNGTDAESTIVSQSWGFTVDVAPTFQIGYPAANAIIAANQTTIVWARVYDNTAPQSCTLSVDGTVIKSTPDAYDASSSSYTIQGYQTWTTGVHTIEAKAVEPGGRESVRTWTVTAGGQLTLNETGIANGQVFTTNKLTWHFLSNSLYSTPDCWVTIDGSAGMYSYAESYSNNNHDMDLAITPWNMLPDGPHTVVAQSWAAPSLSVSKTYNITTAVPPTVTHLRPARDVSGTSTTPTLIARATDNSEVAPTFAFALDGVPLDSESVRTINATFWEGTLPITTPLAANSAHTASVTVTDAGGISATETWEFFVAAGSQMQHYNAGGCADCHGQLSAVHSGNLVYERQYACNGCHSDADLDYPYVLFDHTDYQGGQIDNPATYVPRSFASNAFTSCSCHNTTQPASDDYADIFHAPNWSTYDDTICRTCHAELDRFNDLGEMVNGRGTTTTLISEVPRHAVDGDHAACADCHQLDLTYEHAAAGRTDADGQPITCQTCHESTDPLVVAAIASGNGACEACHVSPDHESIHVSPTSSSCFGAGCHDASKSLTKAHERYVGPGSPNPTYATTCDLCHANPAVNPALSDMRCTGVCHANSHTYYSERHTVTAASAACSECHGTDLTGIHKAYDDFSRCGSLCHERAGNWSKTADCAGCHAGIDHTSAHGASPSVTAACTECHSANIVDEHTGRGFTCGTCHNAAVASASGSSSVLAALGVPQPDAPAEVAAAASSGPSIGVDAPEYAGMTGIDVIEAIQAGDTSCDTCHPSYHGNMVSESLGNPAYPQYVAWAEAQELASANADAALMAQGPHKGYATTTIKCAVCHSVHRGGTTLLNEGTACAYCHTTGSWGGGAVASNLISWGTQANAAGQTSTGPHSSCSSSYCHGGPHGVGASSYDGPASKLLTGAADAKLGELAAANGVATGTFGTYNATTRALATAAVCGRTGCHDNSMFGVVTAGASSTLSGMGAVTGHRVVAANTATWNLDARFPTSVTGTVAYAPVSYCNSCHDLRDDNNAGKAAFPHAINGVIDAAAGADGSGRPAVWLTAGAFAGAPRSAVSRYNDYAGGATVGEAAGSSILDGVCLKCHRGSATSGVGFDY